MKKGAKNFVPKPNGFGGHNWCVPYAWATLLGRDYNDVYKEICDCLGRKVGGVYPVEEPKIAKHFGVKGAWIGAWRYRDFGDKKAPAKNLRNVDAWVENLQKMLAKDGWDDYEPDKGSFMNKAFKAKQRFYMIHVTEHAMVWDHKLKLVIDNQNKEWVPADKHHNRLKRIKRIGVVLDCNPPEREPAPRQVGQSDAAKEKKVYYNRVRRTCKKYDIELQYVGEHKNYTGLKILGLAFEGYMKVANSDINWKAVYKYLQKKGFKGGVK